jgi:hypothetical protein
MIHHVFRTLILLAVSALLVSGGLASNNSLQQNTSPNAVQNGSQNTNPPSNTPNMNKAPNPKHPAAAPAGPIPPAIQAGITAMQSAKASLESAGDKWGGHRIKAIRLINQALKACGQTPAPQSAATNSNVDNPAALQAGITQLTAAQKHFTGATDSWGGRKDKALPLIQQALQELQLAASLAKKQKKPANG